MLEDYFQLVDYSCGSVCCVVSTYYAHTEFKFTIIMRV